jgi:L-alanine-DL-glutamate epimerase-like enolase superfamily enzyme
LKIIGITTESYSWPRIKPITNGKHTYTHSGLGLVRIETDEGITGIGRGSTGGVGKEVMK